MTNVSDPTLEDDMRRWLYAMVDAAVTDPDERAERYREIEAAIAKLQEPKKGATSGKNS